MNILSANRKSCFVQKFDKICVRPRKNKKSQREIQNKKSQTQEENRIILSIYLMRIRSRGILTVKDTKFDRGNLSRLHMIRKCEGICYNNGIFYLLVFSFLVWFSIHTNYICDSFQFSLS